MIGIWTERTHVLHEHEWFVNIKNMTYLPISYLALFPEYRFGKAAECRHTQCVLTGTGRGGATATRAGHNGSPAGSSSQPAIEMKGKIELSHLKPLFQGKIALFYSRTNLIIQKIYVKKSTICCCTQAASIDYRWIFVYYKPN